MTKVDYKYLWKATSCISILAMFSGTSAVAQDFTLRLHHPFTDAFAVHHYLVSDWAASVAASSQNRLQVEIHQQANLFELADSVIDGTIDIAVLTPIRRLEFATAAVFELPFMVEEPVSASLAFWHLLEEPAMRNDFAEVKVLATWVEGPYPIHSRHKLSSLDDLAGFRMAAPGPIHPYLESLSVVPINNTAGETREGMRSFAIDGALVTWEMAELLGLSENARVHAEFEGHGLFARSFMLMMNRDAYNGLSDDLRSVIDNHSGPDISKQIASALHAQNGVARNSLAGSANRRTTLNADSDPRWKEAADRFADDWVADVTARIGIETPNADKLQERAKERILEFSQ